MVRPERVHDSIAAVSSELGGTVGVAARNLATQAIAGIADDLYEHLGDPA